MIYLESFIFIYEITMKLINIMIVYKNVKKVLYLIITHFKYILFENVKVKFEYKSIHYIYIYIDCYYKENINKHFKIKN